MGINEINGYLINENSISFIHRALSVKSPNKKKSIFNKLTSFGMDIAMIIAPLLTYCFQINKFYKTKSSKGFSKLICFLLFLGNTFRIFFWLGTHFKKTLLYQSIGIVIFQIILIHLCIKYQDSPIQLKFLPDAMKNSINNNQQKSLIYHLIHWKETFTLKNIWKWRIEIEYYKFMFFIGVILMILCEIFQSNKVFFHLIGIMSAFFESLTCVPQIIENYKTKNTDNLSFTMIFFWFLGDSFRLFYNIKYKAPIQMISAIALQVTFDLVVCLQICVYRKGKNISLLKIKQKKIEEINKLMRKIDELNIKGNPKKENYEEIKVDLKKSSSGGEENEGEKNIRSNTSES